MDFKKWENVLDTSIQILKKYIPNVHAYILQSAVAQFEENKCSSMYVPPLGI